MGATTFDRLLREYCGRFRWKMAGSGDFISLAAETCRCALDDLVAAWGAGP